ncbi:GNAT family N-acetyltransferase [Paenarthrobacter nitroguajacolicus]|uniref:GNAT family N-acetyltransferase n=1 Tax=Paenarthrobacter nitroguajacolicus TaxID=211146 RepID=A0A558GXL2_PAENT|nr:GNAT family N-acetyltransferase [Paenarthrobacter nitroguajacolicus]TVU61623.1 GNAT family N-acetyltransferase [Paenarthrobacter nitroguajacolicus]
MAHHDATSSVETAPASWAAVEELFGTKGEPSRCWCRWFALSGKDWSSTSPDDRKQLLKTAFTTGPAPGVLAFRDGHPIGWCAVEPRINYPRLKRSQVLRAEYPRPEDSVNLWAVSCFVVAPSQRRRGVSAALLAAAVDHAFDNGAQVIEAYPVDTEVRAKATAADLYHGTLSLFTAAGFSPASESVPGRPVVRLEKAGASPRARSGSSGLRR